RRAHPLRHPVPSRRSSDLKDVQNIDLMNLAGFCRNCLAKWMVAAAEAQGETLTYEQARERVYGMPYEQWKQQYQKEASPDQLAADRKSTRLNSSHVKNSYA